MKFLIVNGVNLNLTGLRERSVYGRASLAEINDAIASIDIPVAEVHMSNICAREGFRSRSVLSEVCRGVVFGFGAASYLAAMEGLKRAAEQGEIK